MNTGSAIERISAAGRMNAGSIIEGISAAGDGVEEPCRIHSGRDACEPFFRVEDLNVVLGTGPSQVQVLHDLGVVLPDGATTVMVGASGSGKSQLIRTLLGIVGKPGPISGRMWFRHPGIRGRGVMEEDSADGRVDLLEGIGDAARHHPRHGWQVSHRWRRAFVHRYASLWGDVFGFIPQSGKLGLDPSRPIGVSIREAIRRRSPGLDRVAVRERAVRWLKRLAFESPRDALRRYPSQLSGGMAQRAALAVALARGACILFADEPTTGLDPASAASFLRVLDELRSADDDEASPIRSLVLVTHDLAIAERLADWVVVIDRGRVVEQCPGGRFFGSEGPSHPASIRLLEGTRAFGRRARDEGRRDGGAEGVSPRLVVSGLCKSYVEKRIFFGKKRRKVLDDVSLELYPGEIVGLIGPSGMGKTTLAACMIRLIEPDGGDIVLDGRSLMSLSRRELRRFRRRFQLLFQQPIAAMHPHMNVRRALLETARHVVGLGEREAVSRVDGILRNVGLEEQAHRYRHELSGGQLRRVGLARVMLVEPAVLIVDEPTAGIDAPLRHGVLHMLRALAEGEARTAVLLISHDRQVIRHVADRIFSMESGGRLRAVSSGALAAPSLGIEGGSVPSRRQPSSGRRLAGTPMDGKHELDE